MAYVNHKSILKPGRMVIGVFLSASVLGACSQVPDAVNPAEWYRGTVDLFAGEDTDAAKKQDSQKNGKDAGKDGGLVADRGRTPPGSGGFPKLSSVDKQARARDNLSGGLSADPERPKYAPAISRQAPSTATVQARPPSVTSPRAPSVAAVQPPPKAVPSKPVTQAPVMKTLKLAKPSPAAKFSPPVMTAEQKANEQRLARQLAEIRARGAALADVPVTSRGQVMEGEPDTIVISSEGIQTLGAMAAETNLPQVPSAPPQNGAGSQLLDRPAPLFTGPAVRVATILFDNGSSKLKALDKRILDAVVRLQRERGGQIRIVGHASSRTRNLTPVEHKMANFKISADRADSVASALVRLGAKKTDIQIAAVSDSEPLYYEIMPSGEAGNRRTEVYLVN